MSVQSPAPAAPAPAKSNNTTIFVIVGGLVVCMCGGVALLLFGPPVLMMMLAVFARAVAPEETAPVVVQAPSATPTRVVLSASGITVDGRTVKASALQMEFCAGSGPISIESDAEISYDRVVNVIDAAKACHREASIVTPDR